jgi:hypothetical protein
MGAESDLLRDLVDNQYPAIIANINSSIASIEAEESDLNDVKDALEWQMNAAGDDTISIIETLKADVSYTFDDWKVLNITDFQGYDEITGLTGLTIIGASTFRVDGNKTSTFSMGKEILLKNTVPTTFHGIVSSSTYDAVNLWTTVSMDDPNSDDFSGTAASVFKVVYEFEGTGWDSDADIIANEAIFQESYAHINDEIGTDGTYGIDDKLSKLALAKSVLNNDKTKYTDGITNYDKFAT